MIAHGDREVAGTEFGLQGNGTPFFKTKQAIPKDRLFEKNR